MFHAKHVQLVGDQLPLLEHDLVEVELVSPFHRRQGRIPLAHDCQNNAFPDEAPPQVGIMPDSQRSATNFKLMKSKSGSRLEAQCALRPTRQTMRSGERSGKPSF